MDPQYLWEPRRWGGLSKRARHGRGREGLRRDGLLRGGRAGCRVGRGRGGGGRCGCGGGEGKVQGEGGEGNSQNGRDPKEGEQAALAFSDLILGRGLALRRNHAARGVEGGHGLVRVQIKEARVGT